MVTLARGFLELLKQQTEVKTIFKYQLYTAKHWIESLLFNVKRLPEEENKRIEESLKYILLQKAK